MRFFPETGHFLMAGNAEGHVKLYDVHKNRTCAQTYVGHTKAIRDVEISKDGKNFLTASFDKVIHYWDTETGKVLRTFKLKKFTFCVKFDPESSKQNVFLAGGANNKITQFDLNSGTKVLQYDQHLSTVNTITWIEPKKFVSSSDDKKLFVWEFGIPVVYKHVSEPEMHAVTAAALHPNGEYFAGQSSDNQIVIYEAKGGNFRRNRAKKFASHRCAGYACGISFSPDGQFLVSGDERGKLFFYDWKTSKNYRTTDAHPKVCIGAEWHPNDPTMVATCGW